MALVAVLMLALALPSFADESTANITSFSGNAGAHPYRLTINKPADSEKQIVLNAYGSSTPNPNTPVTTWINENHPTQEWSQETTITAFDSSGNWYVGSPLQSAANPDVAININRASATPEVNLYTMIGNKFRDSSIYRSGNLWYVRPRYNHAYNMYLKTTAPLPNSSGGTYLQWNTSGSTFYLYDISWNEYQ